MATVPACVGLGSNLGDRRAILASAVDALAAAPGVSVRSVSLAIETAPVGGPSGQGPFLNAAAVLDTSLAPEDLLSVLRAVERDAGRVRRVRWGERTLDLDLLLFGPLVCDTPELSVPHPRMGVRRFVLGPLAEIAPHAIDPMTGLTIERLRANLDRAPGVVGLVLDGTGPSSDALATALRQAVPSGWSVEAVDRKAIPDASLCASWVFGLMIEAPTPEGRRNLAGLVSRPLLWASPDDVRAMAADLRAACESSRPA
jgi:2-amino-4-hydroxy-6-hydroxymethyldihydropteridine diphosphokinase